MINLIVPRKLICFSLITFFALPSCLFSQIIPAEGFQLRAKYGFLVGHRGVMGHLAQEHAVAQELGYVFRTQGAKSWHATYSYPDIGIHWFYGSVGNTEILGRYTGFFASISFPFIHREHFRLNARLGAGLAYTNKVYNPEINPKNVAISTPLNALIELGLDASFYFGKNWMTLGLDLTHFSNGSFRVPNLGLNIPYLSLAYGRFISLKEQQNTARLSSVPKNRFLFGATAIASVKEIYPTGGKTYGVYALSLHTRIFSKPKTGWELALDIISKQALYGYRSEVKKQANQILQAGLYTGYLLPLNQFHFVLGMGIYIRDRYDPDGMFYHRVGMRYYFNNGVFINVVLKTHWAKADYVEWGIGYSLFAKKKN